MDLDSIVINNLDVLASLKEKDNLIVYENSLNINNSTDFQDLNNNDIKNTIISTLLYCLYHDCTLNVKDSLLLRIDLSISNIYENSIMNELLEKDDFFSEYLKNIDDMHTLEVQRFQRNKCNRFLFHLNDGFTYFCSNLILFSKRVIEVQSMINGISFNEEDKSDESDEDIVDDNNENFEENTDEKKND